MNKSYALPDKLILIFIYLLYIIGIGIYIGAFLLDYQNNINLYTGMFFIFVIFNRLAFHSFANKKRLKYYLYLTELCFLVYLLFLYIYDFEYFIRYKILAIPAIILVHVQLFFYQKMKQNHEKS
ncbi:hypothetical protein SAMN04487989_102236 [Bizionia echini]|uniref:Uncharacterized protein n=1 Tax=Bizionia echini TaxID=649333 RepID=A0A1I5ARI2_9FLAO|nr:hypothetical protein SAMN04487989_102236 [Bizionia echini]